MTEEDVEGDIEGDAEGDAEDGAEEDAEEDPELNLKFVNCSINCVFFVSRCHHCHDVTGVRNAGYRQRVHLYLLM